MMFPSGPQPVDEPLSWKWWVFYVVMLLLALGLLAATT